MAALVVSDHMKNSTRPAPGSASPIADMWPLLIVAVCIVVAAAIHFKAVRIARQVAVYAAAAAAARAIKENAS